MRSSLKYPTRRAYVTLEFYNEASLDKQLAELKAKLLGGTEKKEQTTMYGGNSLMLLVEQMYTDNHKRERIVSLENGQKVELVKSRV